MTACRRNRSLGDDLLWHRFCSQIYAITPAFGLIAIDRRLPAYNRSFKLLRIAYLRPFRMEQVEEYVVRVKRNRRTEDNWKDTKDLGSESGAPTASQPASKSGGV